MLLLCWLITITSCAMSLQAKKSKQKTYSEDLSSHRMKFENTKETAMPSTTEKKKGKRPNQVNSNYAITSQLDALLDSIQLKNKQVEYIQGYTIQVYAGSSRTMALAAKNKLYTHYPSARPEMYYERPNYLVRWGRFLDKLEAYSMYAEIKKLLPNAIIRPAYFPNEPNSINNEQRNQGYNQEACEQ